MSTGGKILSIGIDKIAGSSDCCCNGVCCTCVQTDCYSPPIDGPEYTMKNWSTFLPELFWTSVTTYRFPDESIVSITRDGFGDPIPGSPEVPEGSEVLGTSYCITNTCRAADYFWDIGSLQIEESEIDYSNSKLCDIPGDIITRIKVNDPIGVPEDDLTWIRGTKKAVCVANSSPITFKSTCVNCPDISDDCDHTVGELYSKISSLCGFFIQNTKKICCNLKDPPESPDWPENGDCESCCLCEEEEEEEEEEEDIELP